MIKSLTFQSRVTGSLLLNIPLCFGFGSCGFFAFVLFFEHRNLSTRLLWLGIKDCLPVISGSQTLEFQSSMEDLATKN